MAFQLPEWVAPNTITLTGLLFSVLSLVLTLVFNPSLGVHGPRWLHLFSAMCLFVYQTLDNMDGQQARRTKTSSPLGMLFDHGCDAVNACLSSITMGSVFGTGWTMGVFLGVFSGFFPFYIQTWEEYYVGEMILPVVNGPTEGLLSICIAAVLSFLWGANWWHEPGTWELKSLFPSFLVPPGRYSSSACLSMGPGTSAGCFSSFLLRQR